jgi:glutaredoxin
MSDRDTEPIIQPQSLQVTAECPHCERTEQFLEELTARAWMTGHIQEEHGDQLPQFNNE